MTAPRGSGAFFNEILENVVKRTKAHADAMAKMVSQSGYAPLTEPLTLRDLKKMPPDQARAALREELARTTATDANGELVPNAKTLDLISGYLRFEQGGIE